MKSFLEVTFEVEYLKYFTLSSCSVPNTLDCESRNFFIDFRKLQSSPDDMGTALEDTTDTEVKSRIVGVQAKMENFNFFSVSISEFWHLATPII